MSFKREGDDKSQLNLLKKRRVSDLLADDVPEDEAFLMSNGRYACTVCHHRPVLDTISMLSVHRQGKRHQGYVMSYYAKKQNLMKEVEKRKQQVYLLKQQENSSSLEEVEDVAPLLTKTRKATHHALLKAAPYKGYAGTSRKQENSSQSFLSKTAGSFFQRVSQNSLQQEPSGLAPATSTTLVGSLPGNRNHLCISQSEVTTDGPSSNRTKGQDKTSDAIGGSAGVSDRDWRSESRSQGGPPDPLTVFEKRCPTSFQLKPYIPKHQRSQGIVNQAPLASNSAAVPPARNDNESKTTVSSPADHETTSSETPPSLEAYTSGLETTRGSGGIEKNPNRIPCKDSKCPKGKIPKSASGSQKSNSVGRDYRSTEREKYLKLTSSGWKTDWKGGWEQDQDVEFDSDEEVPL